MSEPMIIALIASMSTILASTGLWAYILRQKTAKAARDRLLLGLAYDKIVTLGVAYIQRDWISKDEYEEYFKNLVEPYREMGGNGVAEKVAEKVGTLSFRSVTFVEIVNQGRQQHDAAE